LLPIRVDPMHVHLTSYPLPTPFFLFFQSWLNYALLLFLFWWYSSGVSRHACYFSCIPTSPEDCRRLPTHVYGPRTGTMRRET
jgi:hypothetical protein